LLPVGAAADYLGVSRATVQRLVSQGQLPLVKVGASTRYDVEDLDGFIATNRCRDRRTVGLTPCLYVSLPCGKERDREGA
jgi:excisionase family DNA binding protein